MEEFADKAGIKLQHVPFKGFAEGMQAMLGGHVMSHSDSTGWAPHVEAGTARLLATYGQATKKWPNSPTLAGTRLRHDLRVALRHWRPQGHGPGRHPPPARRLSQTLEDPAVLATFEKYDQSVIYMNGDDYAKFIAQQFQKEKVLIEQLGLAVKT